MCGGGQPSPPDNEPWDQPGDPSPLQSGKHLDTGTGCCWRRAGQGSEMRLGCRREGTSKSPSRAGGEVKAAGGSLHTGITYELTEEFAESSSRRTAAGLKCRELIRDKQGQNPAGQNHPKLQASRNPGGRAHSPQTLTGQLMPLEGGQKCSINISVPYLVRRGKKHLYHMRMKYFPVH